MKYVDIIKLTEKLEKQMGCNIQHSIYVSQRSTGKTYSFLYNAFKRWIDSGEVEQCAYVRRWDSDFDGSNGARAVYNSLVCNGEGKNAIKSISKGKYDAVEYRAGCYYVGRYDKKEGKTIWFRDKIICYGFSLNLCERIKGGSFPHITMIGFDEFLSTSGYLKNEFSATQSIVSTIVRNRNDVHCYYMANTVSFFGYPCWGDWGFEDDIKKIKKGESKLYSYDNGMKVVFHWLDMDAKAEKPSESNIYFGFDNSASKMITKGDWELPNFPHVPDDIEILPKDILFIFFIQFHEELLQCEICQKDSSRFTFVHKKTTKLKNPEEDVVFTDDIQNSYKPNYSYGFRQKNDEMHQRIKTWILTNPIFFQDNLTGYFFYTYFEQTNDITGKK